MGTLADLIAHYWNQEKADQTVGERKIALAEKGFLGINGQRIEMRIEAFLYIKKNTYVGNLPIDLQGFKNEQTGGVMAREFTTDKIYPAQIEAEAESGTSKNWRKIEDPEKLSIKVFFSLSYKDLFPISTEIQ